MLRDVVPDPKPPRRIVDDGLMAEMRNAGLSGECPCVACGERLTEPHHVRLRSQGGDDVEGNIVFLCGKCHGEYHRRGHDTEVRFLLGRFLRSDRGRYVRAYLVGKLGRKGAQSYMQRQFGVRL